MEVETQNSKTLILSKFQETLSMDENPIVKENPPSEPMELENPSTNFAISEQILGNSSEIERFQSNENPKKEENPVTKIVEIENPVFESMESENPFSDLIHTDEILEGYLNFEEEDEEEVKCSENFGEIDKKGVEFTETLDCGVEDKSVKGKNDDAEIKNVVEEASNEDSKDTPIIMADVDMSDDEEDPMPFRSRWSEGQYGHGCRCGNCSGDEEDDWMMSNRLGFHSQPSWLLRRMHRGGQMGFINRGIHSKRHCRRRGFNHRKERENDYFGLSLDDCTGAPEPEPCPVGAGLANLGNTCFLNAIVQCFTHTVPLVQGVLSLKHEASSHGADDFCVLCAVRSQIEHSFVHSGRVISPSNLVENLSNISSYFRRYQQEDAHEFLQCLLDRLDSNWLKYEASANVSTLPVDTLVEQIFGGRLVSQVRCCNCGHSSDTQEPLIDLSLEIEDADSLESALNSFTKVESIEDTEKFTCDSCKEQVKVEKQLMVDKAPSVAALHLKRFKSNGVLVEKIDKKVDFPVELDLSPYTNGSNDENEDLKYELFAVVVHVGLTMTSGHYFCYIRSSPQNWYRFDDSQVTKVDEGNVLCQDAYILFYAKKGTPWFDSCFENWKAECREKMSSTSPKSVLDELDLPSTSYSVGTGLHGRGAIGDPSTAPLNELNQVEVQNKPGIGTGLNGSEADGMKDAAGDVSTEPASELNQVEVQIKPGIGTGLNGSEADGMKDATGDVSTEPASELVEDEVKSKSGVDAWDSGVANQTSAIPLTLSKDINDEVKEDDLKPDDLLMEESKATENKTCCEKIGEIEQNSRVKTCSPPHANNTFASVPKDKVCVTPSTPARALSPLIQEEKKRALSPDIYSDESDSEAAYIIPTNHLKTEGKPSSSAKKSNNRSNTLKQDVKKKEAFKYIRKSMPRGRGQHFMAALNGSKSDSLLSKKRNFQLRHSPRKRPKLSPKSVLRTVTA